MRLAKSVVVLGAVAILALALLFLLTPSARIAPSLLAAAAKRRGPTYADGAVPRRFAAALVATEDHRFYSPFDPGIDPIAVARVIFGRLAGRTGQGGSTIEQQLAKMLYTPGRGGALVELEQMALAIKLDLTWSKAKILSMYAETAYFGDGYYGLAAAGRGYFGKEPAALTWPEAAVLPGVVNAPSADDPRTHPKRARERERHVLARLVAVGDLDRGEAATAFSRPLGIVPRR